MMEVTKRNLVLTFGTVLGTELDIVIKNPGESLPLQKIKDAMDAIIASSAIGEVAVADRISGAKYVIQQEDELELPA